MRSEDRLHQPDDVSGDVVIARRPGPRAWPALVLLAAGVAVVAIPPLVGYRPSSEDDDFLVDLLLWVVGFALVLAGVVLLAHSLLTRSLSGLPPAARLGAAGIDYRAASGTDYDVHVGWDEIIGCRVRKSPSGTMMLHFDVRDPERVIAASAGPVGDALDVTHREHGTPLAVSLAQYPNVDIIEVGRVVRAGTDGRVNLT